MRHSPHNYPRRHDLPLLIISESSRSFRSLRLFSCGHRLSATPYQRRKMGRRWRYKLDGKNALIFEEFELVRMGGVWPLP